MNTINNGGQAFPWCGDLNECPTINLGMELRDYFAARAPAEIPDWFITRYPTPSMAPSGPREREDFYQRHREIVYFKWRWYYADAMLRARGAA